MRSIGPIIFTAAIVFASTASAAPPQIVPPGWKPVGKPETTARVFVSPDGFASIRFGHEAAHANPRGNDADRFVHKPNEQVTYEQRGVSWFVVSGYRGREIFYRKGNLACGGSRWNLIEFRYPREEKLKMDATVAMVAHNMAAYGRDCG